MPKPNLVPERRIDKNGITSIRWVKPATFDGADSAAIPAPSATSPIVTVDPQLVHKAALVADAAQMFVTEVMEGEEHRYDADEYLSETKSAFSGFPLRLVDDILAPSESPYMKMFGLKIIIDEEGTSNHELMRDYLNHAAMLSVEYEFDCDDAICFIMSATQRHGLLDPLDMDESYPEKRKQQVSSLLKGFVIMEALYNEGSLDAGAFRFESDPQRMSRLPIIVNGELASLFINRPEEADRIVDFISSRKSTDTEALKTYLDHGERVMAEGIL